MKPTHIIILLLIAGGIIALFSTMGSFTQYYDIKTAKAKPGKFVQIVGELDKNSIKWDPIANPNYIEFLVKDSTGVSRVSYKDSKPTDMEKSEKIVLKGKMDVNGNFNCENILLKCPSKYKDEESQIKKNVEASLTN
jgi:cytochrome c-type biogenesis protein CcmE